MDNNTDQQLADIRRLWSELNARIDSLEKENRQLTQQIKTNRYKTTQNKLINKFRFSIICVCVMLVYINVFFGTNPYFDDTYRWPTLIVCDLFFIGAIAVDAYLLLQIRKIDIYTYSVSETARQIRRVRKIHIRYICCSLPASLGVIVLMSLCMKVNQYQVVGVITGFVSGLTIGIFILRRFMRLYRDLEGDERTK